MGIHLQFKVFSQTFEDGMGPFKAPGHTTPPMCVAYRNNGPIAILCEICKLYLFCSISGVNLGMYGGNLKGVYRHIKTPLLQERILGIQFTLECGM